MSAISSELLLVTVDPRGFGGKPGVLTVESVISDLVRTDAIDNKNQDPAAFVDAKGLAINTSVSGDQLGVANGIATLDAGGKVPLSQIPDVVAAGLDAKGSCRAKTNVALPAYTASGSGVGKTMTADAVGALPSIDGVSLTTGDRILVDQSGSASNVDNGIYTITTIGDGATAWVLTRAEDADGAGEVSTGTYTFIEEGTSFAVKGYVVDTANPITIDTTAITWTTFSSGLIGSTTGDNTSVGSGSLANIGAGVDNTTVGVGSSAALTSGNRNTALGTTSLALVTTGNNNTAIGISSMDGTGTGVSNHTAVGAYTLRTVNDTGARATAVGYSALTALTTGDDNTAVGASALTTMTTGNNNTAFGSAALESALGASSNTAMGHSSCNAISSGSSNTGIGAGALSTCTTASSNTAVGFNAARDMTSSGATAVGATALQNATGANNTAFGFAAGLTITSGSGNTLIGAAADVSAANSIDRIAIGNGAVSDTNYKCQIGYDGVSAGTAALQFRTQTIISESFIGNGVGVCTIDNSGNFGFLAGTPITGIITSDNTAAGFDTFASRTTGNQNTAFGSDTLTALTSAKNNTAIGTSALAAVTSNTSGKANSYNVAVGRNALALANNATGTGNGAGGNTAVGDSTLAVLTTGSYNTAVGSYAGGAITTGASNVLIGAAAGGAINSGSNNVAIGSTTTLASATTTSNNIAVGVGALNDFTGSNTVAVGTNAGGNLTTGSNNTMFGYAALAAQTTGSRNTAFGYASLTSVLPTAGGEGDDNTAFGANSGNAITTGSDNTIFGSSAGNTITTGNSNICIGAAADVSAAGAVHQIAIGFGATAPGDYSVQLGRNADDSTGILRFKSQTIARESWIGGGITSASIDNDGNIIRGGAFVPTAESLSIAGGAADSPDVSSGAPSTTFIITTGTGTATGELADGANDGQIKFLLATALAVEYQLDVTTSTTLYDAVGSVVSSMNFTAVGNSATIMWDDTRAHWLIVGAGVTLA